MNKPRAIVIYFNGDTPNPRDVKALGQLVYDTMTNGTNPTIVVLSEQDMSKILCGRILASRAPKLATEEGDNAAAIIDMFTGKTDRHDGAKLCLNYYRQIVKAEHDNSESSKNFIKAMSILAQGNPISDEYMRRHNITKQMLSAIKDVYNDYAAS